MRAAEIDVPIIVLSGLDDEKSKMDSVKAGAQDFFVKGKVEGESLIRGIRYAIERKRILSERERLIDELQAARDNIKVLTGLLPVCMQCKKIRDDKGYWSQMEVYIEANSEADFTHGICDECKETVIKGIRKNH
jgi:DNA-binding NtrC family response regulator